MGERMSSACRFLIVVFDSLRPERLSANQTPNLYEFCRCGAVFSKSRSFPTLTRVNKVSLVTGATPSDDGVLLTCSTIPPSFRTASSISGTWTSCSRPMRGDVDSSRPRPSVRFWLGPAGKWQPFTPGCPGHRGWSTTEALSWGTAIFQSTAPQFATRSIWPRRSSSGSARSPQRDTRTGLGLTMP